MRLIDADALIERAEKDKGVTWYCYDEVKALLEDTPTVNVPFDKKCIYCKYNNLEGCYAENCEDCKKKQLCEICGKCKFKDMWEWRGES